MDMHGCGFSFAWESLTLLLFQSESMKSNNDHQNYKLRSEALKSSVRCPNSFDDACDLWKGFADC